MEITSPDAIPTNEKDLDANALKLLGEELVKDVTGPAIHDALPVRWNDILKAGLDREIRASLLKKHLIPSNCEYLKAPELNPEIKSILTSLSLKKDWYNRAKQQQLAAGVSALGTALSAVLNLKETEENMQIRSLLIENLGDGARLFADLFHEFSVTRRSFIIPGLNVTAKGVAENCPIDDLLFGKDFGEKHKNAMALERNAKTLAKPTKKPTTRFDSAKSSNPRAPDSLNPRNPPKKNGKPNRSGGGHKQRSDSKGRAQQRIHR